MEIARCAKITGNPGGGGEIERILLEAAVSLESNPGCLLYLVSRQRDDGDIVWVQELWRDEDALNAARSAASVDPSVRDVMAKVQSWEMIELNLAGGKGLSPVPGQRL